MMDRYTRLLTNCPYLGLKQFQRGVKLRHARKTQPQLKSVTRNIDSALEHFDGLYSRVYGKRWPSIRLGLLSPRKYCAILNTFVDNNDMPEGAIDLQAHYAKRLQIMEKKSTQQSNELSSSDAQIETNEAGNKISEDVEDSETETERDLASMFKETSLDDDDKPFYNQASMNISLNDYVPTSEYIFHEDLPDEPIRYDGTIRDVDKNIQIIDHPPLTLQGHLKVFTLPRGDWSRFDEPAVVPKAHVFSYYLMDGASILPVLLLEAKFDDVCADYCAAPGGKSIALVMTLKPKYLLCNDSSNARLRRMHNVFRQYVPEISYVRDLLNFTGKDARKLVHPDTFDKILVDVPCSNDRNSIESVENNIFKRTRTEERLNLPANQCDILKSALKSLRTNGDVVYSTCTLSPLENDAVVKRALLQLRQEGFPANYAVMDLRETLRPFSRLFAISKKFVYGQQVVPNVCSNYGPMYISKIRRIS